MQKQKGFSLVEICIATCVSAILIGIGAYQFSKYHGTTEKKELNNIAENFALSMKSCIVKSGGWMVKTWKSTDTTEPTQISHPCDARNKADLASKLNFTCPSKVNCTGHIKSSGSIFCLSMQKTIQGKKHEVIVNFNINSREWKTYCGQVTTYNTLSDTSCIATPTWTGLSNPCEW